MLALIGLWSIVAVSTVVAVSIVIVARPLAVAFGRVFPGLRAWTKNHEPREYFVEVEMPVEGETRWFPLGRSRPTLEQAKAALEACRRIKSYGRFPMRIRSDEYPLVFVKPGDPPLIKLH